MAKKSSTSDKKATQGIVVHVERVGLATPARPFLVEFFPSHDQIAAEEIARARELAVQERNARHALATVQEKWWKRKDVVGLSVTYKTKFGEVVSPLQFVIQVEVERKYSEDYLRKKRIKIFTREVIGTGKLDWPVTVKVREMRYVAAIATGHTLSSSASSLMKANEIKGGIQIASILTPDEWGTLGICVPHGLTEPRELVGITNLHVAGIPNTVIRNPSGTTTSKGNENFGHVSASSIDQAMIVKDPSPAPAIDRPFNEGLINSQGLLKPSDVIGTDILFLTDSVMTGSGIGEVRKVGARTGLTNGFIDQESHPQIKVRINGVLEEFNKVITFKGHSTSTVMDGGDSGSVLLADVNGKTVVLGLIFAQTDATSLGVALPFGRVIKALRLKIDPLRKFTFK